MKKQAFVIQHVGRQISEERRRAERVMNSIIQPACKKTGYEPVRADQLPAKSIVVPIISALSASHMVITDLGSPPWKANVLMEIGFRLANGRPIVFLSDIEPDPSILPLHLQDKRILQINFDQPVQDNITSLCEYIKDQERDMDEGWQSDYPIVEFSVPLQNPKEACFIYANQAAAMLYGVDDRSDLLAMSVEDADDQLK